MHIKSKRTVRESFPHLNWTLRAVRIEDRLLYFLNFMMESRKIVPPFPAPILDFKESRTILWM